MPEDVGTVDNHQVGYDDRLIDLEQYMRKRGKDGASFPEILKRFTHALSRSGKHYSVKEGTLYDYLEHEEKIGNVRYEDSRYYWIADCNYDELKFE